MRFARRETRRGLYALALRPASGAALIAPGLGRRRVVFWHRDPPVPGGDLAQGEVDRVPGEFG